MIDNISEYCVHNKHSLLSSANYSSASSFFQINIIFVIRYILYLLLALNLLIYRLRGRIVVLLHCIHHHITKTAYSPCFFTWSVSIWKCGAAFDGIVLLCGKLLLTPISDLYIFFDWCFGFCFARFTWVSFLSIWFIMPEPSRIIIKKIILKNFLIKSKYHHQEYEFIQLCGWKRKILWTLNAEHTIDISGYHSIIKNLFISLR